jgi:hypothetical protein
MTSGRRGNPDFGFTGFHGFLTRLEAANPALYSFAAELLNAPSSFRRIP